MSRPLERFAAYVQDHWLALAIAFLLLYSGLPVGGALLKAAGWDAAAQVIYQPYKALCHTYGFRSFFLFGEQTVYSRAEFEQQTGIDTTTARGLLAARNYQGDARVGYKVALCQRDMAIYPAMALGGLLFAGIGPEVEVRLTARHRPVPEAKLGRRGLHIGLRCVREEDDDRVHVLCDA